MFRNRHFMLGIGIGLIAGALLLQIIMIGQGQQNKLVTEEQVKQAAEKLNLRVVGEDELLLTEEEWESRMAEDKLDPADTAEEPSEPEQPEAPNTPATPQDPQSDSGQAPGANGESKPQTDKPAAPEKPEAGVPKEADAAVINAVKEPEPVTVKYKISYGDSLTEVANGLQKAGVISSSDTFIKEASKRGINKKIRTGTYTFQVGEKHSSIITKITTKSKQ
ncbi:YceG-like family protein [compost metagenome]